MDLRFSDQQLVSDLSDLQPSLLWVETQQQQQISKGLSYLLSHLQKDLVLLQPFLRSLLFKGNAVISLLLS